MKKLFFFLLSLILFVSCNGQRREGASTEIVLETTLGDIHIALILPDIVTISYRIFAMVNTTVSRSIVSYETL